MRTSAGRLSRTICCRISRPSPIETPGVRDDWIVIERRRSKRLSACGAADSVRVTKEERGTSSPLPARMKVLVRSFGDARSSGRARMITGYSSPRLTKVETSRLAEHQFERAADILHRDAEIGGALPVDLDADVGLRLAVVRVHVDELARLLRLLHDDVAPAADRVVVGPAEHELDRLAETAGAAEGGRVDRRQARAPGKFDTFGVIWRTMLLLLHRALLPRHEAHDHDALVDRGGTREAGSHLAQHGGDDALLLQGHERALDLLHPVAGVVEARALRRLDADDDGAAILRRREFLRQGLEQAVGRERHQEADERG